MFKKLFLLVFGLCCFSVFAECGLHESFMSNTKMLWHDGIYLIWGKYWYDRSTATVFETIGTTKDTAQYPQSLMAKLTNCHMFEECCYPRCINYCEAVSGLNPVIFQNNKKYFVLIASHQINCYHAPIVGAGWTCEGQTISFLFDSSLNIIQKIEHPSSIPSFPSYGGVSVKFINNNTTLWTSKSSFADFNFVPFKIFYQNWEIKIDTVNHTHSIRYFKEEAVPIKVQPNIHKTKFASSNNQILYYINGRKINGNSKGIIVSNNHIQCKGF